MFLHAHHPSLELPYHLDHVGVKLRHGRARRRPEHAVQTGWLCGLTGKGPYSEAEISSRAFYAKPRDLYVIIKFEIVF